MNRSLARFQQDVVREAAENEDILQHDIIEHPWNVTLLSINGLQVRKAKMEVTNFVISGIWKNNQAKLHTLYRHDLKLL